MVGGGGCRDSSHCSHRCTRAHAHANANACTRNYCANLSTCLNMSLKRSLWPWFSRAPQLGHLADVFLNQHALLQSPQHIKPSECDDVVQKCARVSKSRSRGQQARATAPVPSSRFSVRRVWVTELSDTLTTRPAQPRESVLVQDAVVKVVVRDARL